MILTPFPIGYFILLLFLASPLFVVPPASQPLSDKGRCKRSKDADGSDDQSQVGAAPTPVCGDVHASMLDRQVKTTDVA